MKTTIASLFLVLFSLAAMAQVDDEVGFIYMKGEYLMQTQRYNDAISEYSRVILKEPDYKDALLKRAKAQYELGAYRATQDDLQESIELKGIDYETLALMGSTNHHLGNHEAAVNTLATALRLGKDGELSYLKAKSHYALDEIEDMCADLQKAKLAGVSAANDMSKKYCNGVSKTTKPSPSRDKPTRPSTSNTRDDIPGKDRMDEVEPEPEPIPEEPKQPFDDSVNKVEVDEDLTIIVKNGLGGRTIEKQPNILILSDDTGIVGIDVCVDDGGKVTSAELNSGVSNLQSPSIISLAKRKAKEFWFNNSEWPETCGTILFQITGR